MICDDFAPKDIFDIRKQKALVLTPPHFIDIGPERVATELTDTAFGGKRRWLLCPNCDRRCAVIYRMGNGPRWACRICHNGKYASETMSPQMRRIQKSRKIRKRLGEPNGNALLPLPAKPKGMHWKTYHRLCDELEDLELEILEIDLASLVGPIALQAWKDRR